MGDFEHFKVCVAAQSPGLCVFGEEMLENMTFPPERCITRKSLEFASEQVLNPLDFWNDVEAKVYQLDNNTESIPYISDANNPLSIHFWRQ